ncbi:MAG TPA: tryptophan 2,3-dioxygenase family protein [Mycobacteriales bacterium]|jgi:tryptophan 2,3-dioxygenase|nr:tryptophan 2,3-dioxygenase family protein [Mycobacteriales bacterium]
MSAPRTGDERRFGEEGARLSYGSYLRLAELLAQQVPASGDAGAQEAPAGGDGRPDPQPAHDELLFITIHQVYELWFQQLLHELGDARDRMLAGEEYAPRLRLQRAHAIERVLVEQVDVLETMTPQDFLAFRALLAPASGFQSVQFREIEFLSGAKDEAYLRRLAHASEGERTRLARRLAEPTLWDGFVLLLGKAGFDVTTEESRRAALLEVSRDRMAYGPLWDLAEALIEHDSMWARWRSRHVLMVERQIGTKSGTGGSTGAPYLRARLGLRFYPELWDLRSYL